MSGVPGFPVSVRLAKLSDASHWTGVLSDEERSAAERIANLPLKARFVLTRGLRRTMISEATGIDPGALTFVEAESAKPRANHVGGWDFNISHSGDHVAVAVAQGRVGVDLEEVRPVRTMDGILERYFHPDERDAWFALNQGLREGAFFILWSAREASMKCVGLGLARGLAVTRVDPAILTEDTSVARVGNAAVALRRLRDLRGYALVVAHSAE